MCFEFWMSILKRVRCRPCIFSISAKVRIKKCMFMVSHQPSSFILNLFSWLTGILYSAKSQHRTHKTFINFNGKHILFKVNHYLLHFIHNIVSTLTENVYFSYSMVYIINFCSLKHGTERIIKCIEYEYYKPYWDYF